MTSGDSDDFYIIASGQRPTKLDCSDARTSRALAPALLEGERHAHTTHLLHSVGGRSHTLESP